MIIIVRHGRTASNAAGLLLGRADPPLDETGVVQARQLGAAVGSVDRIIASPLTRTVQTANEIAALHANDEAPLVETDERFLELDYGEWDGRPVSDVSPSEWAAWRSDPEFAPPGGESIAALGRRVRSALDDIAAESATSNVVVATHVSPIKAAVSWALDGGDDLVWRLFVAPASITKVQVNGLSRSLHGFNEVGHLGEPRRQN